jgi:hypothetical protein
MLTSMPAHFFIWNMRIRLRRKSTRYYAVEKLSGLSLSSEKESVCVGSGAVMGPITQKKYFTFEDAYSTNN